MRYQREIDGLRAISVLAVIFFHAGFGVFAGGFVGVDVFFVISGYLITGQIYPAIADGKFSLWGFFARRARRLLPALFPMVFFCIPVAWFTLMPLEMKDFAQSVLAVTGSGSNFLFWKEIQYFAPAAEFKPFLHTWSLAVEEQFYFCLPLLFLSVRGWPRKRTMGLISIGIVLSCGLAQYCSLNQPTANFFLLPSRCWELLCGSLLALTANEQRPYPGWLGSSASALGLLMLVGAFLGFHAETRHPGLFTLIPVLGTVLLIRFSAPSNWVGRLLGNRLLVGIGLVSYSTYLWHHPLFAFTRIVFQEPHPIALFALCGLSVLLGYLSWRYVEKPFRKSGEVSDKKFYLSVATALAVSVAFAVVGHRLEGFPSRLTASQLESVAYESYDMDTVFERKCYLRPGVQQPLFDSSCDGVITTDNQKQRVFLWGDSYSAHLRMGLRAVHPHLSLAQFSSMCPPILATDFHHGVQCVNYDAYILERLARFRPSQVILAANWITHKRNLNRLEETLAVVRRIAPQADILVVGNMPHWYPSLPARLAASHTGLDKVRSLAASLHPSSESDSFLRQVSERQGARFHSVLEKVCDRASLCQAVLPWKGGFRPFAFDSGHLTEAGSERVVGTMPLSID
jgi:peptidoglycan/LPS O-acetylase OafA/YrhL